MRARPQFLGSIYSLRASTRMSQRFWKIPEWGPESVLGPRPLVAAFQGGVPSKFA